MDVSLHDLQILHHVFAQRSFRKAAQALQLTPSSISHAVSRLEQQLEIRLLNRTTRSVHPTPAGEALLQRLSPAFAEIRAALDQLNSERNKPVGRLRLNMPRMAARLVFMPRLAEWHASYPDIQLEIVTNDALVDIVREGFDAGVRFGERLQQDMVAIRIGPPIGFAVCASPDYLARYGQPEEPAELLQHRCMQLRFPGGAQYRWEFQRDNAKLQLATQGPLVSDDLDVLLQGALDGAGICYHYQDSVAPYVARGELVYLLQDWWPPTEHFYLYYPGQRNVPAPLQALAAFFRSRT